MLDEDAIFEKRNETISDLKKRKKWTPTKIPDAVVYDRKNFARKYWFLKSLFEDRGWDLRAPKMKEY